MVRKYQFEDETPLQVKIPWDKNTAVGFVISIFATAFLLFLMSLVGPDTPSVPKLRTNTVPLTILNFGEGDGTGLSKGNLTKEGETHKGKEPNSQLEDAQV